MASYAGPVRATENPVTRRQLIRLFALVVCLLSAQGLSSSSAQPQVPLRAHPDFTGVWAGPNGGGGGARTRPELLPQAAELYARNKAGIMASDPAVDPTLRCLPPGFPRGMIAALPAYFVQSKDVLAIVGEGGGRPRLIYIGGKHDPGYWDTFMGESVATWDGDVLVIDTVKITVDAFLDADGLPHSDALHVVNP